MPSPPTARPPSTYHEYKGDVRVQSIFVDAVESHRRRGQKHRILYPGTDRFELERMDVWNYDTICNPCLILQPKKTAEVSSIVKGYTTGVKNTLTEIKRTGEKLGIPRLCVCGGRNSMNAMMEGSIVLDLSRMKGVDVDAEAKTVTVQGGATVHDLDDELGKFGLMAVSGIFQNLGVVGCILGGGFGYSSRVHGLACDNVLSAELIIADGRLKRCSPTKNEDLYWSLCGGGGGIGVVTQVTLRCYPLCNAALLTYDLSSPSARMRRRIVDRWAEWACGGNGAPEEVYSHIILRTDWKLVSFLGTSVDTGVVPQSKDHLEQFNDVMKKKGSLVRDLSILSGSSSSLVDLPTSWDRVPGLALLKKNKFGTRLRFKSKFRMVRYCDELQPLGDALFAPGNVYIACKYATVMSAQIMDILTRATMSDSPNKESRIVVSSAGGAINRIPKSEVAFDARDINFVIYIEGRWSDSVNDEKVEHDKKKVVRWVHAAASQLQFCEGIKSTAHPESTRDYVSKSGKSRPPSGWYNFEAENGTRLAGIKKRRDPRNVFSLASRVSWEKTRSQHIGSANSSSPTTRTSSPTVSSPSIAKNQGVAKAKAERVEAMRSVRNRIDDDSDDEDDGTLETTDDRFEVAKSNSKDSDSSLDRSNGYGSEEDDDSRNCRNERRRLRERHGESSRSFGQDTFASVLEEESDEELSEWDDEDEEARLDGRDYQDDMASTERSLTPSPTYNGVEEV